MELKTKLSEKNPYRLPKHRFLELQHFCLQYDDWKREVAKLNGLPAYSGIGEIRPSSKGVSDKTGDIAVKLTKYTAKMDLVRSIIKLADDELSPYLFIGVTRGWSYDKMYTNFGSLVPCSRAEYYKAYRKFFWLLSEARD